MSSFFPLFVDVTKFQIVFIGGGRIAERRIRTLCQFETNIRVIAPDLSDGLKEMVRCGQIQWVQRCYTKGDLWEPNIGMAVIATNDRQINHTAAMEATQKGIPVSVADCKEESTFYFPGIAKKENIVAGVTASGVDHKEAARITQKIRQLLEEE